MPEKRYKVIFMGTPDFAVPGLRALSCDARFEIISVVTQEDKPIGRKQELNAPAVKRAAQELSLNVLQPTRLKNITTELVNLAPDFIVVIAYGRILPEAILNIPKIACVNVHASLLPKYRGAACLQAPILNGDSETGITVMLMDKGLDTGDILRQAKIKLDGSENLEIIHDRLSKIGAEILGDTLIDFADKKIKPQKQDESFTSYVKIIDKKDGQINWDSDAQKIERQIRAFNPWPGTFSFLESKMLKIIKAQVIENADNKLEIGQIFTENKQLLVKCRQNALLILELQLEGKKVMDSPSFLAGHADISGKKLK
ncbi:MAG: methionyl-tRNA formyltransferase [Candidatus Falkowbacteria bacterium]